MKTNTIKLSEITKQFIRLQDKEDLFMEFILGVSDAEMKQIRSELKSIKPEDFEYDV